jgi:hypothetical protein
MDRYYPRYLNSGATVSSTKYLQLVISSRFGGVTAMIGSVAVTPPNFQKMVKLYRYIYSVGQRGSAPAAPYSNTTGPLQHQNVAAD